MLGVVLCGGQSTRMATDKGLLISNGLTWAECAFNKLATQNIPIVLSIHKQQLEKYLPYFSNDKFVIDDASLLVGGPLLGLLSIHKKHPTENILLLACDMPAMQPQVLQRLLEEHGNHATKDGVVYVSDYGAEPLCAIYTAGGLSKIISFYNRGELVRHSMQYIIGQLDVLNLTIPTDWQPFFKNCNDKTDLDSL